MAFTTSRPAFVVNGPLRTNVISGTLLCELPPFLARAFIEVQVHTSSPFMQFDLQRRDAGGGVVQTIRMYGALNQFFFDMNVGDYLQLRTYANPPEGIVEVGGSIYGWI